MTKILKAKFPERCHGCELCVFEVQRQIKKVGLEGSFIRIFKKSKDSDKRINGSGVESISDEMVSQRSVQTEFTPEIDPRTGVLDLGKIKKICPRLVFEIEETDD